MAIESLSSKSSMTSYADVSKQHVDPVKQPVAKEPKANPQPAKQVAQTAVKETPKKVTNVVPFDPNEQNETTGEALIEASNKMRAAIDKVNTKMAPARTKCEFSYHEETKRVSIKVIDKDTDEVIREIPPEETLDMLTKMWEIAGLLVDEKR